MLPLWQCSHLCKRLFRVTLARCRYLMVSLAAYYVFAIIGMELFSHRFIRGKLVGTAYFNNDYWKNNFDTLVRGRDKCLSHGVPC